MAIRKGKLGAKLYEQLSLLPTLYYPIVTDYKYGSFIYPQITDEINNKNEAFGSNETENMNTWWFYALHLTFLYDEGKTAYGTEEGRILTQLVSLYFRLSTFSLSASSLS